MPKKKGGQDGQRARSPEDSKPSADTSGAEANSQFQAEEAPDQKELDPLTIFKGQPGINSIYGYFYGEEARKKAVSVDELVMFLQNTHPKLVDKVAGQGGDPEVGDETWTKAMEQSWNIVNALPSGVFVKGQEKGKDLLTRWVTAASRYFSASSKPYPATYVSIAYQQYLAHVNTAMNQLSHLGVMCDAYTRLSTATLESIGEPLGVSSAQVLNFQRYLQDFKAHNQSLTKPPNEVTTNEPSLQRTNNPAITILKREPGSNRVDLYLKDQEDHRKFALKYFEQIRKPPGESAGGGDGGGRDPGGPSCGICGSPDHSQDRCPWRKPEDGKGPYCPRCNRRGHEAWACPRRPGAPPCSYCGEYGHEADRCPLEARRARRLRDERPTRSLEETRLAFKAGVPMVPRDSSSEVEEPPQEDPRVALKRQLRRDRRIQEERAIERVSREETRQQQFLLADLPRIRKELMFVITSGQCEYEDQLDASQRKKLDEAMLQVYTHQLSRGPNRGLDEGHTSASLKELGVDHITKFNGLEHKYAIKVFLAKFEEIRGFKKWNSQVSASALGQLLDGTALDFYENYKRGFPSGTRLEYIPLRDALLTQFYQKFTLSEKTRMMTSLKYEVARHRSHIHFLTECQKQSFLIYDRGPSLDNESELITRRQAREEMVLMFFVAGCAPIIRHEIEYSRAETKTQIEAAIRRKEEAIRAQDNSGRHDLEPGYHVKEISLEQIEEEMVALQYPPAEISAVIKAKGGRPGDRTYAGGDLTCYYCELPGHRRSECPTLKRDQERNQVHPDKCGPKVGAPPAVDALARRKRRPPPKTGSSRRKEKPASRPRSRKVNEVELSEEGSSSDSYSDSEEEESTRGASSRPPPSPQWPGGGLPFWPPWPAYWPYQQPVNATTQQAPAEPLQAAEITRQGVRKTNPYDLL